VRLRGGATPAILTQFITAASSLILQVFVARWLGASALGSFAIFLSILITINALQSGWLGDSLTVLQRFDPAIRGALFASQGVIAVLAFVVGAGLSYLLDVGSVTTCLICGAATTLWCVEETGRRMMMARLEFWQLVVNDSAYGGAAIGFAVLVAVAGDLTLAWVIVAMAAGSTLAIIVALVQLPSVEWKRGHVERASAGIRTLSSFATWRAGQAGLRPLGLLILRVTVVIFTTRALLGQMEAARLLMAPAITLVAGGGLFLLPVYARNERLGGTARNANPPGPAALLLAIATIAYGLVALVFVGPLTELLTSGEVQPSRLAVFAWIVWTVGYGSGLPFGNKAVARQMSRQVFFIRVIDTIVGVVLVILVVDFLDHELAPLGAGVGMMVGTYLLARLLRRNPVRTTKAESQ
jgi:O-antigen/teichoic acid export membrane protein